MKHQCTYADLNNHIFALVFSHISVHSLLKMVHLSKAAVGLAFLSPEMETNGGEV